jgi:hypothetical protein
MSVVISFSLIAQTNIIPKPNKVIMGEGIFQLDDKSVICSNEKSTQNLNYLKSLLTKATGFSLTESDIIPLSNYIFLDFSESYNIPKEGYTLQ